MQGLIQRGQRRAPPDRSIAAARNGEREQGREYCARAPDGPVENDPAAEAQNDPAQRARNGPPQKVSGIGCVVIVAELPRLITTAARGSTHLRRRYAGRIVASR